MQVKRTMVSRYFEPLVVAWARVHLWTMVDVDTLALGTRADTAGLVLERKALKRGRDRLDRARCRAARARVPVAGERGPWLIDGSSIRGDDEGCRE